MLITDITQAVEDRWTPTVAAAKMNRLIDAAVRFYSRFNPLEVAGYEFDTEADVAVYDMPAACIAVKEVIYPYSAANVNTGSDSILSTGPIEPYNEPSIGVIKDINQDAYLGRTMGYWYYRSVSTELVLDPMPSGATTVRVTYYAKHSKNAGSTAYTTVPDTDLELIRDLVVADLVEAAGSEMATMPDYTEGLEKEAFGKVGGNSFAVAEQLRQKVSDRYKQAPIMAAP